MVADNRPHTGPGGVQEGPQSAPIVPPEFPTVGTHHHDDHRGAGDDPRVRRMARADLTLRRIYEAVTPVEAQHGGKRLGMFSRKEGETLDGVAAALDVHPPEHVIEVAVSRARAVLRGECDPKLWRFLFRDNGFEAARQAHESAQTRTQRRADEAAERAGPSVDQCISPEQIATLREGAGFLRGSG